MDALLIPIPVLAAGFFFIALIYSSVGLGGGSSYTALLTLFGASHRVVPGVSLTLNVLVASTSALAYLRAGHVRPRVILPFVITSIPAAYLGGRIPLAERPFLILLAGSLVLIAALLLTWKPPETRRALPRPARIATSLVIGAVLGLLSGLVGIGGGIFLIPLILLLGLADAKEAAATGAVFIVLNSLAGLAAHLERLPALSTIAPLLIAVFAGAVLGGHLGARRYSRRAVQRVLAVVLLVAAGLLSLRI